MRIVGRGGDVIGTNRRYAHHYDRLADQRIIEQIAARGGPLQTLTEVELQLGSQAVTIDPQPKPVRAWVRFGETPVLVSGAAVRWTADAVGVSFVVGGTTYRTWVWASAVTPHGAPAASP